MIRGLGRRTFNDITIIGAGNMGSGIAARGAAARRSLQLLDQDVDNARQLAGTLDVDADHGSVGDVPAGDIVALAVPCEAAKDIVADYGAALSEKMVVEITNPVDHDTFDSFVVAPDTSAAETITRLADDRVRVVKTFNTTVAATLRTTGEVAGQPLDVVIAGESDETKRKVSDFASAAAHRRGSAAAGTRTGGVPIPGDDPTGRSGIPDVRLEHRADDPGTLVRIS